MYGKNLLQEIERYAQKLVFLVKAMKLDFDVIHAHDWTTFLAASRVKELTGGRGADIVIDVSAYATQPVADALKMVRVGGKIVLAGVKGFKPVEDFISDYIVTKEIQVMGAMGVTTKGYRAAINLIEARKVDLLKMHTHNFPLAEAELAIKTLAREIEDDSSIHSCLIPEH